MKEIKIMNERERIIHAIENIVEARDLIFTQIVNLAMSGEMSHLKDMVDLGESYSFTLQHFEELEDINVQKLVLLCKQTEAIVFSLIDLNNISENEVEL